MVKVFQVQRNAEQGLITSDSISCFVRKSFNLTTVIQF